MYNLSIKSFVLSGALCLCLWGACVPVTVNAILNGVNATIDMFPEMVQLSQRYFRSHVCGGFLATDRHVVTAAHCVVDPNARYLKVIANTTYTLEGGIERDIEAFYVPEDYNKKSEWDWDMAVIKLKEPFPLGKGIQVAKMSDKRWRDNTMIQIAGWGITAVDGPHPEQLLTASVATITDRACRRRMRNFETSHGERLFENITLTGTMSCALAKGHVDTCQGDSGGPVYIDGIVYGIVSFGMGCGHGKRPSVYSSIAKTRNFINAALCYKPSDVELKSVLAARPDLLCHAVKDENATSFFIHIPGSVTVINPPTT